MATVTLDGTTYDSADLANGGHRDPDVGFFAILTAMVAELAAADTVQSVAPGALGGLLQSDGAAWTRAGFLRLASVSSITPGTNQDNLATGDAAVIRVTPSAAINLTGLASPENGRVLMLLNLSDTYDVTLKHESASSTAANRIDLEDDTDLVLSGGQAALLWYDSTASRWRVLSRPPASSFVGARVYQTSAVAMANATYSVVTFHAEGIDVGGYWTAGSPTRFTVPANKAGKYRLKARVGWDASGTGVRLAAFYKNGSDLGNLGDRDRQIGSASDFASNHIEAIVDLVATDYVEVYAYQNAGGSLNTRGDQTGEVNFEIEYLGT